MNSLYKICSKILHGTKVIIICKTYYKKLHIYHQGSMVWWLAPSSSNTKVMSSNSVLANFFSIIFPSNDYFRAIQYFWANLVQWIHFSICCLLLLNWFELVLGSLRRSSTGDLCQDYSWVLLYRQQTKHLYWSIQKEPKIAIFFINMCQPWCPFMKLIFDDESIF